MSQASMVFTNTVMACLVIFFGKLYSLHSFANSAKNNFCFNYFALLTEMISARILIAISDEV